MLISTLHRISLNIWYLIPPMGYIIILIPQIISMPLPTSLCRITPASLPIVMPIVDQWALLFINLTPPPLNSLWIPSNPSLAGSSWLVVGLQSPGDIPVTKTQSQACAKPKFIVSMKLPYWSLSTTSSSVISIYLHIKNENQGAIQWSKGTTTKMMRWGDLQENLVSENLKNSTISISHILSWYTYVYMHTG